MGEDRVRVLGPAAPGWVSCALLEGPDAGKPAMWTMCGTATVEGPSLARATRMLVTLAVMLLWWEARLLWYRAKYALRSS